ncbi:MAG: hypothetical protein KZQ94_21305 [Candidatus Thiodiazotropha sp. (ex Troendleina suluensis)]|nr:hypothetical protein [Candidatus Thiodiazotropha sp. (ex Troendleina suluensis)]
MLKLNVNRTFNVPVPVVFVDEQGDEQTGEFKATFRILSETEAKVPENTGKRLLELVVQDIQELELVDQDGHSLQGQELKEAALADPTLSSALVSSYWDNAVKKPQPKT